MQVLDPSVSPVVVLKAFFGVCEASLELGADAAQEIVRCMGSLVCEAPNPDLNEKES